MLGLKILRQNDLRHVTVHSVLIETLGLHFGLDAGLVQSRTVTLSHLAVHLSGPARPCLEIPKYRRQRFFQFVRLDQAVAARRGA